MNSYPLSYHNTRVKCVDGKKKKTQIVETCW